MLSIDLTFFAVIFKITHKLYIKYKLDVKSHHRNEAQYVHDITFI